MSKSSSPTKQQLLPPTYLFPREPGILAKHKSSVHDLDNRDRKINHVTRSPQRPALVPRVHHGIVTRRLVIVDEGGKRQSKVRHGKGENRHGDAKGGGAHDAPKRGRLPDLRVAEAVTQLGEYNDKQGVDDASVEDGNQAGVLVDLVEAADAGCRVGYPIKGAVVVLPRCENDAGNVGDDAERQGPEERMLAAGEFAAGPWWRKRRRLATRKTDGKLAPS